MDKLDEFKVWLEPRMHNSRFSQTQHYLVSLVTNNPAL